MSKWYQGKDGWEEGREVIDLGYDGSFTAIRRKVWDGCALYEGVFWNATTEERTASYLEVLFEGDNIDHWIQAQILPRHYEVYEDTQENTFHLFIIDYQGYLEFYATFTNSADLYQKLREFNQTGFAEEDWEVNAANDFAVWRQLRQCRMSDRFRLILDNTGTYLKKHYDEYDEKLEQQSQ